MNWKYLYVIVSGKGVKFKRYILFIFMCVVVWMYVIGLLIVLIGILYFFIFIVFFLKLRGGGLYVNNFIISYYEVLFIMGFLGLEVLWNSFFFLFVIVIIVVMIGVFLVFMIWKGKKIFEKWFDMCGMLLNMVLGIVMVVGFILFWNLLYMFMLIYNILVMVIVMYVVLFLFYMV